MSWAYDIIRMIVAELSHDQVDLQACGQDVVTNLRVAAQSLLGNRSLQQSCEQLDALADVAHAKMTSSPICWRRIYTDVCLLRTLADVEFGPSFNAMECIARLDRAIIISGGPGLEKLDLIISIIRKIQLQYLHNSPVSSHFLLPKLPRSSVQVIQIETSSNPVPSLDNLPSLSSFRRTFSQHPFVLRGYACDWPAMQDHPWSSVGYLRFVAGPGRVVPVEVGKDYRNDDWSQKLMNWDDFLDSLDFRDQPSKQAQENVLYLAQHNLLTQFPALRADIIIPDYLYACPSCPTDFHGYQPPGNQEQLVLNAWLGPKGTISPAHTDPYFNFYVQVVGRKTVWLAPPRTSPSMYRYPASAGQAHPAANTTNPSMSNTSRVDVFPLSMTAMDASLRDYPDFWVNVIPDAIHATLEPGDVLFFPPGWWHAMRSEETSFSVSMWF